MHKKNGLDMSNMNRRALYLWNRPEATQAFSSIRFSQFLLAMIFKYNWVIWEFWSNLFVISLEIKIVKIHVSKNWIEEKVEF